MGKILLVGCGAVAMSFLELLSRTDIIPKSWYAEGITVIEPKDITKHPVYPHIEITLRHVRKKMTPKNYGVLLSKYADPGDVVIDLSTDVESMNLIKHCVRRGLLYLNTSVENWTIKHQEEFDPSPAEVIDRSLYMQNILLEKLGDAHPGCATILTDHGMNPGLISHFTKWGLLKFAVSKKLITGKQAEELAKVTSHAQWAKLAERAGLRVVHCSERDTQVLKPNFRKDGNTFYNTWSCHGFMAEGRDPVQLGYGTHENFTEISNKVVIPRVGLKHQIFLPIRGMDLMLKSYVPHTEIHGYAIPHGEAYSLCKFFSNGKSYRPSVYYVYQCSKAGDESMKRLRDNDYVEPEHDHVFTSYDLSRGHDAVGALMMYENADGNKETWWSGTILDLKQTRAMGFKTTPTVVQVAISIISATKWMIDNPRKGIRTAEELPLEVLERCMPYLGNVICEPMPYKPESLQFQDMIVKSLTKQ